MEDVISKEGQFWLFVCLGCLLIAFFMVIPEHGFAQPGLPEPDPEQTPIDGGLGILAALGGTYAVKKLREKE